MEFWFWGRRIGPVEYVMHDGVALRCGIYRRNIFKVGHNKMEGSGVRVRLNFNINSIIRILS